LSIHGGVSESKEGRRTSGGSEMSLEIFVFIVVVGAASGLIYGVLISKWRKDQKRE